MHWQLAILALVLLGFAAISARVDGTPITAPMVFTAAGLVFGVEALGLVDPSVTGTGVRTLAEATLTVVLFSDASRIDLGALKRTLGIPTRLLGIGLPLTILAGFLVALAILGDLAWPEGSSSRSSSRPRMPHSVRRSSRRRGSRRVCARASMSRAV
jgi:NhaP-type Na+/H+ or K+/H+ antiporter